MPKLSRLITLLVILLLSGLSFAQRKISIGANKLLLEATEYNSDLSLGFRDLTLEEQEKASCFILCGEKKFGPFNHLEKKVLKRDDGESEEKATVSYFIADMNGDSYLLLGTMKFGPYSNPELIKIAQDKAVIIDYSEQGSYYELYGIAGEEPTLIRKSERFPDPLTGIYISDNLDMVLTFDEGSETGEYFIYEGKRTGGFYRAIDMIGWMHGGSGGLIPVFSCIAPLDHEDEMYDVTNDLYVGNNLVAKIVAVLYDFSFNAARTDFIVKGYSGKRDGARVYSSRNVLGPYESVSGLKYDSLDRISFEFEKDGRSYLYSGGELSPLAHGEERVLWKNNSPYSSDYVQGISVKTGIDIYYNDLLIAKGEEWDFRMVQWTRKHGPVMLEELWKPVSLIGEEQEGRLPDGYRLIIHGIPTKKYERIFDFSESPDGEIAYLVQENGARYIIRGDNSYGPYENVYTIGKERDKFFLWSKDGKDLYYSVIADQQSKVLVNDKMLAVFPAMIHTYFDTEAENFAAVLIKRPDCYVESDFLTVPLDGDELAAWMDEQVQWGLRERMEELSKLDDCCSVFVRGNEFSGLRYVHRAQFSGDGKVFAFYAITEPYAIYKKELLNGLLLNNTFIYYKDGKIHISDL